MPLNSEESRAVRNFLKVFEANSKIEPEAVGNALFGQKHMLDANSSREYVDRFFQKCEKRDPSASKNLSRRANSLMNTSDNLLFAMEFIVRCRQSHLFYHKSSVSTVANSADLQGITRSSSNMSSAQSSPFQRRSASRTRVFSNLTADNQLLNESTRSRANTSFNSYDTRNLGMERSAVGISRPKSPFRILNSTTGKVQTTPTSASNHLFNSSLSSTLRTPQNREQSPYRTNSNFTNGSVGSINSSAVRVTNLASSTPLHSRMGSAICETESTVCECLLAALLGIDSRLFRSDGARKMTISSTASLTTTHVGIAYRVLETANIFTHLSHRELANYEEEPIQCALIASIRHLLGEYTADIDALRRTKNNLTFSKILPAINVWNIRLILMNKCYSLRKLDQLDLLEAIFIIHRQYNFDEDRKSILDIMVDYTMGVFCKQMIEWMKTGEVPCEKWVIERNKLTDEMKIRKVPVFLTESDMKILLEIGKSLPKIDSSSDEDLLAVEQATKIVTAGLSPRAIFNRELSPLLRILRDVVCGIVMRTVMSTGRLKDHLNKATSVFFLNDPIFTVTLFSVIKDASMGLRVGTTSLSRQTVSSALAEAIESSTRHIDEDKKKKKLEFKLDALTSLGNTPNVSSRMQFVQPLRPKYEPTMDLVKPIFRSCDDYYEAIFHVIWAVDLARLSSQETASKLPPMSRFLELNYSLRENARSLLRMLSNICFVINSTLLKIRNVIAIKVHVEFRRLLAAIDEKCVDVDDLIKEHMRFVKRVAIIVFLGDNDKIEPQLSVFLQTTFEAHDLIGQFCEMWDRMIEESSGDQNILKAKMAENCKKWVVNVRVLMDKVNTIQKKLMDDLDHQIMYGNDALIE